MRTEQIARVAYEANRAYARSIREPEQPSWEETTEEHRAMVRAGVEFHLGHYAEGLLVLPAHSHEAWRADMTRSGWRYGTVRDEQKREHPALVPWANLSLEQRRKDYLFTAIVAVFAMGQSLP